MRMLTATLTLLFFTMALRAAPAERDAVPLSPALEPREVQEFSSELYRVIDQVARLYARPVTRMELLKSALVGLYDEAGVPLPDGFYGELHELEKLCARGETEKLKEPWGEADKVMAFIGQTRAWLGERKELRGPAALKASFQAMCRSLDPHTALVSNEEMRRSHGNNAGKGFGMELDIDTATGRMKVKSVVMGGPAQRAGVRPGDEITHVNGTPSATLPDTNPPDFSKLQAWWDSTRQSETKLALTLTRAEGGATAKVTLRGQSFTPEFTMGVARDTKGFWDYLVDREKKIALVRLGALEGGTALELARVLDQLQSEGVRGLILDLRWSPGGLLDESAKISQLFIKKGLLAEVRYRDARGNERFQAAGDNGICTELPLAVLVNGSTSGGAELIAAACQDNQRAKIVGQRTLGKGSVQRLEYLSIPDTGLKMTAGYLIRPNGKGLQRLPDSPAEDEGGIQPDVATMISPDLDQDLREAWQRKSLRPGESNEALPMDDLDNDPPLREALRVVGAEVSE